MGALKYSSLCVYDNDLSGRTGKFNWVLESVVLAISFLSRSTDIAVHRVKNREQSRELALGGRLARRHA